ncbi:MAG: class I SAM-dependent methyltransferase [Bacteroidetes bacterium]|nr:class I SAM-dependent methyltransferase [Bacteroidota bacterium]
MSIHVCPIWLSFSLDNFIRRCFHNPKNILKEYIRPGFIVADIGCGPGYFSIPLAQMVSEKGVVLAVDIQEKMLLKTKKNAEKNHVDHIIKLVKCQPDNLQVGEKTDFLLTFWMVHEVQDIPHLFDQISKIMKPGSLYLLCEPKIHVNGESYQKMIAMAEKAGLKPLREIKIRLSRSMLFTL